LKLNSEITGSPALANDRIYVSSKTGKIYSIGPVDNKPPQIVSTWPKDNDKNIPVTSEIIIKFNERLNPDSIAPSSFLLSDNIDTSVTVGVSYDDKTLSVKIIPEEFLNVSTQYTLSALTRITDYSGNSLDGNKNGIPQGAVIDVYTWSFTTSSNHPPKLSVAKVSPIVGNLGTTFTFSVIYTDSDDNPPASGASGITIFIDDHVTGFKMKLNDTAQTPEEWHDGNYLNGEEYIYTTKLATLGIHNFRIWCHDGIDYNEIEVPSRPILPGPPVLRSIPQLTVKEDVPFELDLAEYLTDPDTPFDDLNIQINSSFVTVENGTLIFRYLNSFTYPGGSRIDTLNITVTDPDFYTSREIKVWVEAVNDPPMIRSIPTQLVVEKRPSTLDLRDYVFDIDNDFKDLKFKINTNYSYIDAGQLIMNYPTGNRQEEIQFNVSDGSDWTLGTINVSVVTSDVSFVIKEIGIINTVEDIETRLDVKNYLIMITGSYTNLKVKTSSSYAKIDGLTIIFLYNDTFNYPVGKTTEKVTLTVTDTSVNYKQSTELFVFVTPVNDAPRLINGQVKPEFGNITQKFEFEVFYQDADGSENFRVYAVIDGVEFEMNIDPSSGSGSSYGTAAKLSPNGIRYTFSSKMGVGYHYYYFKCNDDSKAPNSQYLTDTREFFVTANLDTCYIDPDFDPDIDKDLDSDKDGIPDCWELEYNLDPYDIEDALLDLDGDNFTNLLEYFGHDGLPTGNDSTDPTDASDRPQIQPSARDDSAVMPSWLTFVVLVIAIVIGINILYFMITGRGIGHTMRIPKMMLSPEVRSKHPYLDSSEDERPDESDEDIDVESELEPEHEDKPDYDADTVGEEPVLISEQDTPHSDSDIRELELESEVVEITDLDEEIMTEMNGVPVTEVDLTVEDKPFLESEELIDELSGEDSNNADEAEEAEIDSNRQTKSKQKQRSKASEPAKPKSESGPEDMDDEIDGDSDPGTNDTES
jgi:hypothetical protein